MTYLRLNPLSLKRVFRQGIFCALIVVLMPLADILAGVLVAPPVVFISEKGRTGRLTVQNPTNAPKEVTISFAFGIPESDSLGNVSIDLQDTAVTDPRSALGWVKAFPRKLVIPANGSQIVRFVASPPKDLVDGEYWARVVVQAREGTTTISAPEDDDAITTKLNMIMRTAIMLKYRKGDCVANVELVNTEAQITDSNVYAIVDLTNRGNVSYIGVLSCRLLDADGKEISKNEIHLAVYRDLRRRMELPIVEGDFRRPFTVEVGVTNKGRKDLPQQDMIFGNDILYTLNVEE